VTAPATRPTPCIPGDPFGFSCLAGLLLGVRCCPDGRCALCTRDRDRMRRVGFTEDEIASRVDCVRRRLLARCPACGFPPPAPLHQIPPLPRLDRSRRPLGGAGACRYCGNRLLNSRRRYCDTSCWNASVLETRRDRRADRRLAQA